MVIKYLLIGMILVTLVLMMLVCIALSLIVLEKEDEEEGIRCPSCGNIVPEDYIDISPLNTDDICQDCKENGYYE